MTYTFEKGLNDIAECFARYHGMGLRETKEYFEKIGIMSYIEKHYCSLAYEVDLELVKWLRREISKLDQPLPDQIYFKKVYFYEVPVEP